MLIKCDNCGNTFEREEARLIYKHHFCSRQCYFEWTKAEHAVLVECENCGKVFERIKHHVVNATHIFCSTECQHEWVKKSGILRRENSPRWSSVKIKCDNCGKEFFEMKYKANDKEHHHFCSRKCRNEWMKGENAPGWKNGASFEPYCVKFNEELKEKVREKYGRQCFLCGKTEKENKRKLSVHHVDYDKKGGCNGKKLLLVPLCTSCHIKTNVKRDYWESVIRTKMSKRKLSHSQTILDVYF